MAWLNYHHLLYFWTVAREGSVTRASAVLHLTQPAISTQLRALERAIGERLLERRGRSLVLTDMGRVVFRYADEIFSIGKELQEVLAGRSGTTPKRLVIGVVDGVPKLLAYRLVRPALSAPNRLRVVIREDRLERLLADLATHEVDVVLSDRGAPSGVRVKAFSHLLGDSGITIFGVAELAAACRRRFPRSLQGVPFIMPAADSELRRSLERWFESHQVQPTIVAEIEDSALLKAFGQAGAGLFAAPTAIEAEVRRQYGVRVAGRVDVIRERFYAISAERRITHPAVTSITSAARSNLFGS